MKKLLLLLLLLPTAAWGQCTGVFPANTLCGNLTAAPQPPAAFSASGTIVGPVTSTFHGLPYWTNGLGTALGDAAGSAIAGNYTWTGTNIWNGVVTLNNTVSVVSPINFTSTFQISGATKTFPAGAETLGGLGTSQTWTGVNTFSNTVNLGSTVLLNGTALNTVITDNAVLNNCALSASVGSGNLTVALKGAGGSDTSAASPCTIAFRNTTASTGTYSLLQATAALSIAVPSGANLGTTAAAANRIWIAVFNDTGTPVLGVYNSLANSGGVIGIKAWSENTPASGTLVDTAADSAQTWYTASAVTTKAFRIIGYVESTQAVAGVWSTAPSKVQLFGRGQYKPGSVIQRINSVSTTVATTNNSAGVYNTLTPAQTQAITLNYAGNPVRVRVFGTNSTNGAQPVQLQILRGGSVIGNPISQTGQTGFMTFGIEITDIPNSGSAITYGFGGNANANTLSVPPSGKDSTITLEEFMF